MSVLQYVVVVGVTLGLLCLVFLPMVVDRKWPIIRDPTLTAEGFDVRPDRLTVDEQAIRTYVAQYLRDEIDVEELDRKIGWQLQVGPAPPPSIGLVSGRVTRGVRVDTPDWVRMAERSILERGEKK